MSRNIVEQYHDSLLNDNDTKIEMEDKLSSIEEEIEDAMKEYLKDIISDVVPEELKEYFEGVDVNVSF